MIEPEDRGGWWRIDAVDCFVTIESRPAYCDRGRYIAKIFPTGPKCQIDGQDGWPRYYYGWGRMLLEIEEFLRGRDLLRLPAPAEAVAS